MCRWALCGQHYSALDLYRKIDCFAMSEVLPLFQTELEEMLIETRMSEDKAKKAMMDAARLADELRCEQDHAQRLERERRSLDCQVRSEPGKLAKLLSSSGNRTMQPNPFRCNDNEQ